MTLVEKVIAQHCGRSVVAPGDRVLAEADRVFCYGPALGLFDGVAEGEMPLYPGRVVIAFDQSAGTAPRNGYVRIAPAIRRVAATWKIGSFYDLGRGGIPAVAFPDSGLVRPGDILAGADRQTLMFGALGAVPLVLDTRSVRRAIFEGEVEIDVPPTLRIELEGKLERWVGGHDLGSHLAGLLGRDRVRRKAIEIGGSVARSLDLHHRLSLASALDFLKPAMILVEADEKTRVFVKSRCDKGFPLLTSDRDAAFDDRVTVDCARLKPQVVPVARPGSGDEKAAAIDRAAAEGRTLAVEDAKGTRVDHVIIGGSSHGRIEDLRVVARFLRDYLVNPKVTLTVIAGSQQVLLHAMDEGLTQSIIRAGGHIGPPSSRYLLNAHLEAISEGGHLVSAGYCPGMDGNAFSGGPGAVSFSSPPMATVASIMGEVRTPLDLARTVRRMATGLTR